MKTNQLQAITNWREEQKVMLRQKLYDISLELFRSQGFDNTTMQQIATVSGVAKGTFFNHFQSKWQILLEWYQQITRQALIKAKSRNKRSFSPALLKFCDDLTASIAKDKALWKAKASHSFNDDTAQSGEADLNVELYEFCRDLVERAKQAKQIESSTDESLFAQLFVAIITGTGQNWVVTGQKFNLKKAMHQRIEFIISAVLI